ncbi:hypothetical protein AB4Z54_08880 [Streptomyces sp. MCAF7]
MNPRSAAAGGKDFPYTAKALCYIEVAEEGSVSHGTASGAYERARSGSQPYEYVVTQDGDVFIEVSTGVRFVTVRGAYQRLNVGWLEAGWPWTAGPAPSGFVPKLLTVLEELAANQALGVHECDLCSVPLVDAQPWSAPPGRDTATPVPGQGGSGCPEHRRPPTPRPI